jgi:hypothetical protein
MGFVNRGWCIAGALRDTISMSVLAPNLPAWKVCCAACASGTATGCFNAVVLGQVTEHAAAFARYLSNPVPCNAYVVPSMLLLLGCT